MRVQRTASTGKFSHAGITPSGGMRIDGRPTSVGIFPYTWADGRVMRELREEAEVFEPASLASLLGAAVTELHPESFVTPDNHAELSKGTVMSSVADGDFVASKIDVNNGSTILRIKAEIDPLVEISCGYNCDLEEIGGTWRGEKYDAVQRNIRYNHIGLGPAGWGRHGAAVALRTDKKEARPMLKHLVGGITYEAGSSSHVEACDLAIKTATERADTAEKALKMARVDAPPVAPPAFVVKLATHVLDSWLRAVEKSVSKRDGKPFTFPKSDKKGKDTAAPAEILKMGLAALYPDVNVDDMTPEQLEGAYLMAIRIVAPDTAATELPSVPDVNAPPVAPGPPIAAGATGDDASRVRGMRTDAEDPNVVVPFKSAEQIQREKAERARMAYRTDKRGK